MSIFVTIEPRAYQKNVRGVHAENWVPHQNYLPTCSTDKKFGMNMRKSVKMYQDSWSNGKAQGPLTLGCGFESHVDQTAKKFFFKRNIFAFIFIFTLEFLIYTQISLL